MSVVMEFFCITCARTVYSHRDKTCPVCSSPLLELQAAVSDKMVFDEVEIVLEKPEPGLDRDHEPPAQQTVA